MKPLTPTLLIAEILLLRVLVNTLQSPAAPPTAAITPTPSAPQPLVAHTCRDLLPASVQLYSGDELGSGTIIAPNGVIVTALHVVNAGKVRVRRGQTVLDGIVTQRDTQHDLALVKVKAEQPLPFVQLGGAPALGSVVCSVGNQQNRVTVMDGSVKGVGTQITTTLKSRPGDSGGMVVVGGRLVGVTSAIQVDRNGKPTDEALAVKAEWVRELMNK